MAKYAEAEEIEYLRKRIEVITTNRNALFDENNRLTAENDKLEEALRKINNWVQAYPLEVFPKPDLKKAAVVLKASGMTLDSISADAMRHVLEGIKGIVGEALKGGE